MRYSFPNALRHCPLLVLAIVGALPQDLSAAQENCSPSLQTLVDNAAAGSTVLVPSCIYRETINIGKALTLNGQGQAEIRGSQIWTGWTASGGRWVSNNTVPSLPTFQDGGRCLSGTDNRCLKAEQVFLNGQPLTQVSANPVVGQFALDGSRHVILADDPAARTVEVTTRNRWINFNADGVTIQGFIMKHSGNDAQQGGMTIRSRSRIIIRNNVLSDAHGAVVSMGGGLNAPGTDCQLLNNDIFRGGQEGVHGGGLRNQIIDNKIHNNNTEKFAYGWEAGGFKAAYDRDGIWDGNESYDNDGPGLWCDINCTNLTVRNNRVYRNKVGISFEISNGVKIYGNKVFWNAYPGNGWGYNTGILVSSSRNAEVYDNVSAWNNNDQITVISQRRYQGQAGQNPDWNVPIGNYVHDNKLFGIDGTDADPDKYHANTLGWKQDWAGVLYNASSNNRGAMNLYYYQGAEGTNPYPRFGWSRDYRLLSVFNALPGEEGGRYMTETEKTQILTAAQVPACPACPIP